MASRGILEKLRTFWEREPVIFVSCILGAVGPIFVFLSPLTKVQDEEIRTFPRTYPYHLLTYKKPVQSEVEEE